MAKVLAASVFMANVTEPWDLHVPLALYEVVQGATNFD